MFAVMPPPPPIFGDCLLPPTTMATTTAPSAYRPTTPSPLSSSPIRSSALLSLSSPPREPLSPRGGRRRNNSLEVQSSPIRPSASASASALASASSVAAKFSRFASRPLPRRAPVLQKREAAQENRRRLFLKNVRQRSDEHSWERRGGEQELLKLEWWSLNREMRQAKDADVHGVVSEAEIEDAAEIIQQRQQHAQQRQRPLQQHPLSEMMTASQEDLDEMMVDTIAREEEAELEELISSMPPPPQSTGQRTRSDLSPPHFSDDDDYDSIFMDLLAQREGQFASSSHDDTEMTQ